jgi:hypothetical protein
MATSRTVLPAAATAAEAVPLTGQARRRIDPETGRALIVLGHAIEYLADEFAHEGGSFATHRGQVDAIQLLMALNRQIYMACPEVPTVRQWLRSLLHRELKRSTKAGELAPELSQGRT